MQVISYLGSFSITGKWESPWIMLDLPNLSSSVIVISLDQHFVFQNDWDMGHNVQETSVLQSVVKIEVGAGYGSYNNFAMI